MMKKFNNVKASQNGITLIALVITIIVLLILAGVTINLTLGQNGIFKTAEQAARNYKAAEEKELEDLANFKNTVDSTIKNVTGTKTIDPSVLALKAGDYIKYDSGENGVITCRVLYPASSQYGLQIISDKNVKNVTLGSSKYSEAVTAYNNAIKDLNEEAKGYLNKEYAQDARCVGSIPTVDAKGDFTQKNNGATTYVTLKFTNSSYINSLDADENYTTDQTQMKASGLWEIGEYYWLASRDVNSESSYCVFNIRRTEFNKDLGSYTLVRVAADGATGGYSTDQGLRPCISLKSDIIKITGGTGADADNAYIIGK